MRVATKVEGKITNINEVKGFGFFIVDSKKYNIFKPIFFHIEELESFKKANNGKEKYINKSVENPKGELNPDWVYFDISNIKIGDEIIAREVYRNTRGYEGSKLSIIRNGEEIY